MHINEVIKSVMQITGTTQAELGHKTSKQAVSVSLKSESGPRFTTVVDYLDTMNYKLVAVPKDTSVPVGGIEVDNTHTDKALKRVCCRCGRRIAKKDNLTLTNEGLVCPMCETGRSKVSQHVRKANILAIKAKMTDKSRFNEMKKKYGANHD